MMARMLVFAGFGLMIVAVSLLFEVVYNLFFHPLRKFPGPLTLRATRLAYCYRLVMGTMPMDVLGLHKKYGDVVRVAPDQLAYSNPQAWKEIMGHHGSHAAEMQKYEHYYRPVPEIPTHILNSNREEHAALRRALSHGFSEKRIREQQPIIKQYLDLFIQRLKEKSENGAAPLDMVAWYNYTLFDVIGDLAFGEPFHCLDGSDYHPFVSSFFKAAFTGTLLYAVSYWPWLQKTMIYLTPKKTIKEQAELYIASIKKLYKRMEAQDERPDFIQSLLERKDKLDLDIFKMEANSSTLVAAGSETTATLLSGLTFYLLTNPHTMKILTEEVRSAFKSDEEIDFSSANNLPYLRACIEEALRIYPPTPSGLPRVVPKGGATICGQYVPEDTVVSIYQWAMHHDEKNFTAASEFHPERFLGDARFANDNRDAAQAFHLGPRGCLGKHLAYLEMRTIMARLIWNFDLKLAPDSLDWMSKQVVYDVWKKDSLNVYLTPVSRS